MRALGRRILTAGYEIENEIHIQDCGFAGAQRYVTSITESGDEWARRAIRRLAQNGFAQSQPNRLQLHSLPNSYPATWLIAPHPLPQLQVPEISLGSLAGGRALGSRSLGCFSSLSHYGLGTSCLGTPTSSKRSMTISALASRWGGSGGRSLRTTASAARSADGLGRRRGSLRCIRC